MLPIDRATSWSVSSHGFGYLLVGLNCEFNLISFKSIKYQDSLELIAMIKPILNQGIESIRETNHYYKRAFEVIKKKEF